MSSVYTPTPVALGDITIPDDGDTVEAADVNVPLAAIADGVAFLADRVLRTDVFNASGTWTCPDDVTEILIPAAYGGGGSGGSGSDGTATVDRWVAGGGGGGASMRGSGTVSVTPGSVYNIDVGAGGAAPINSEDNGNDGGSTIFRLAAAELAVFRGGGKGLGAFDHVVGLFEHYALGGVPYPAATRITVGIGGGFRYDTSDAMWQVSGVVLSMQPGQGGWGADGSTHPGSSAGQRNLTGGFTGGAAGTRGIDVSTARGGGGGGGGGAGPGGNGGAGGAGGDAGTLTGVGIAGTAASANTGAGGGGGGAAGHNAAPADGSLGGAGGSGKLIIAYVSVDDAVVT